MALGNYGDFHMKDSYLFWKCHILPTMTIFLRMSQSLPAMILMQLSAFLSSCFGRCDATTNRNSNFLCN
jgi:hypothetical protein